MAALTAERVTPIKDRYRCVSLKVAAVKILQGAMVALNAAGFAKPAANVAGEIVIGRAEETVDNTTGAAGDKSIRVNKGVHKWNNSGTSAVVQATVGKTCMVEDDNTVAATASNSVAAGIVDEIDPDGGIWVSTPNN